MVLDDGLCLRLASGVNFAKISDLLDGPFV